MAKTVTRITKSQLVKLIESAVRENLSKQAKRRSLNENELRSFNEDILRGYLEACAWSSSDMSDDEDGNQHESLDAFDFSPEAELKASKDVSAFVSMVTKALGKDIYQICQDNGHSMSEFGHDLWLTSAGHGAGFWDGDWDMDGDALTKLVEKSPLADNEFNGPYLGEDSLIYFG